MFQPQRSGFDLINSEFLFRKQSDQIRSQTDTCKRFKRNQLILDNLPILCHNVPDNLLTKYPDMPADAMAIIS